MCVCGPVHCICTVSTQLSAEVDSGKAMASENGGKPLLCTTNRPLAGAVRYSCK